MLILSFCSVRSDITGGGASKIVAVNITENKTVSDISSELKSNDVIKHPFIFRMYLKFTGVDMNIKAGIHSVDSNMSYGDLASELSSDPAVEGVAVTIPEGYEFDMIAHAFADAGVADYDTFCFVAENYEFDYDFIDNIPERETRLEGYLFPDTYFVTENDDEVTIINMMLKRFDETYNHEYRLRTGEIGMTVDEIVNLASIIEREAGSSAEMADVSSVFHNRLASNEYPYLQSCATVQYVLHDRKAVLTNDDTKIDSPYNTYINKGLPLGPIASPGAEAIKAALYPSDTNYYFFVADGSGGTIFSETFDEHVVASIPIMEE